VTFSGFSSLAHAPGLRHAITMRCGGVSEGAYTSLNLGYHVGDDAAHVTQNRRRVADALGYKAETLVAAQQVHGAHSRVVEAGATGSGALDWESALRETDALIVQDLQIPLLILVADCAPLLLVDSRQHVLAVVHAGWRGAVAGVASRTVLRMQREFSSQPGDIHAGIGPCLCSDCFEIGVEVAEAAAMAPEAVIPVAPERGQMKPHLDLRALLRHDLEDAGVLPERIETLPPCPRCLNNQFFSHRGQNGTAGRFGLVAWWE